MDIFKEQNEQNIVFLLLCSNKFIDNLNYQFKLEDLLVFFHLFYHMFAVAQS